MAEISPTTRGRMLRINQVCDLTGLSKSGIYERMNEKSPQYDSSFPRQIKLGERSVAWYESEIQEWLSTRPTSSPDGPKRPVAKQEAGLDGHEEPRRNRRPSAERRLTESAHDAGEAQAESSPESMEKNWIKKSALEQQRIEIARQILEDHARKGMPMFYNELMIPLMLSPESPEDCRAMEDILEAIARAAHGEKHALLTALVHNKPMAGSRSRPNDAFFELAKSLGYSCSARDSFVEQQILRLLDIYNPLGKPYAGTTWMEVRRKRFLVRNAS